jgi:hypothetical protein
MRPNLRPEENRCLRASGRGPSRPGRTLGDVFADLDAAYEAQGFPEERRRHHQGGLTGYLGPDGSPSRRIRLPIAESAAAAWNPSIASGAKSEDTALVSDDGAEVVTPTAELPEWDIDDLARPAIAEL